MLIKIAPAKIQPNPENPRVHFDDTRLEQLASSLKKHGMLAPLVAYENPAGTYILVAGERRLRAAAMAGLETVPVLVRAPPTASERLQLALVENLQRAELSPLETARGYQALVQVYGLTQEQVAMLMGMDRATIANTLRLLKLPKAGQDALEAGKITPGHARALLMIEDGRRFGEVLEAVVEKELSVRATEAMARRNPKEEETMDRSVQRLEEELSRSLGSRVEIQKKKDGGGRMVIHFSSEEDLGRLADLLGDC